MCDFGVVSGPATAAAVSAGAAAGTAAAASTSWLSIASLVTGALGTVMQGVSGMQQAKFQAQVAKNNQAIANRAAEDALKRGEQAEDQQRKKTALILGTQRAALAGQGTALDVGSPLDIQGDTAATGELDALTVRSNAEREAWGYRAQASNFGAQAALDQSRAGWLGTGASLLGGATSVADRWFRFRQAGLL